MMGKREDIQLRRLNEGLAEIEQLEDTTARDPRFRSWRDRVQRGLNALFGEESDYAEQFSDLSFNVSMRSDRWSGLDQRYWRRDLMRSRALLEDAIEIYEEAPEEFPIRPEGTVAAQGEAAPITKLVIEQTNTVTQMQTLSFDQVVKSIDLLGLADEEADEARELATDFQEEAEGEGRWSHLGEIAGQLREVGQTVYERVAIPLLLAWIKQEAGLT